MRSVCGKNILMDWVYLSPHLDDVALSCGGMVWEQVRAGNRVSIWTICAGDPAEEDLSPFAKSLHDRWGNHENSIISRRLEDLASCAILGADACHFEVLDCIYRRSPDSGYFLYDSEESLTGPIHPSDKILADRIGEDLVRLLPQGACVVCPLAAGDHVDHHLTRAAAENTTLPLFYYVDYPYVLDAPGQLAALRRDGWTAVRTRVSEQGMDAWEKAVAAHTSQISTFWDNLDEMRAELRDYRQMGVGSTLWQPPE